MGCYQNAEKAAKYLTVGEQAIFIELIKIFSTLAPEKMGALLYKKVSEYLPYLSHLSYIFKICVSISYYFKLSGTLPPFSASLRMTCLCNQIFIVALSLVSPV